MRTQRRCGRIATATKPVKSRCCPCPPTSRCFSVGRKFARLAGSTVVARSTGGWKKRGALHQQSALQGPRHRPAFAFALEHRELAASCAGCNFYRRRQPHSPRERPGGDFRFSSPGPQHFAAQHFLKREHPRQTQALRLGRTVLRVAPRRLFRELTLDCPAPYSTAIMGPSYLNKCGKSDYAINSGTYLSQSTILPGVMATPIWLVRASSFIQRQYVQKISRMVWATPISWQRKLSAPTVMKREVTLGIRVA